MSNIHSVFRPEFTRLILEQLRDRPMDLGGQLLGNEKPSDHSRTLQPNPSLSWEPSAAARQLADIAARNNDKPPAIQFRVHSADPQQIANEVRAALEKSGMSYHASLAKAVEDGRPLQAVAAPPHHHHPFDNAAMLAMTGQLHARIQTPYGDAALILHRTDAEADKRNTGYNGKISAATVAIEHPDLGAIVAHLSLSGKDIVASVRCSASSAESIEASTPQLLRTLWEVGMMPVVNVTTLADD